MKLLLSKTCESCKGLDKISHLYPDIEKYYVEDGMVIIDEKNKIPMDKRIPALPVLLVENYAYVGEDYIQDYLNKSSQKGN